MVSRKTSVEILPRESQLHYQGQLHEKEYKVCNDRSVFSSGLYS